MKLIMMGVDFSHKKGEFCRKAKFSNYTICVFLTPYVYEYNSQLIEGDVGDILIYTPNQIVYHGPRTDSNEGFVNDWMHIEGDDVEELLEKYPLPLNQAFNVGDGLFLRKYFNRLLSEYKSELTGSSDMIKCILTQMIIATHRAYSKQCFQDDSFHEISAVRNAIVKNPEKDWSLEKMSEMSGYSVSRFSELYRNLYNMSPINDVIDHRIAMAKILLQSGQATVSYVATACGFNTINYFSKCFKASTGYTPTEFIRSFGE